MLHLIICLNILLNYYPRSKSKYTVKNSKECIQKFQNIPLDSTSKFASFDMSSLFTSIPLDFTIDVIQQIYREKDIVTNITLNELKEELLLCTKNVHFSFNGQFYLQKDDIAMGSPLGSVIVFIFMVKLERSLLPKLSSYMTSWKHYVDVTIAYVKPDPIDHVLFFLTLFHENISFTCEQEINGKISFLDILILKMVTVLRPLDTVNPPKTISIYTGNHLHHSHKKQIVWKHRPS